MTNHGFNRRELALSMTAAGFLLSASAQAETLSTALPGAPRKWLRGFQPCRFGQVHYRYIQPKQASAKLPILCLHASPGSGITYADFLPLLGTDRLAIAADTPGYGLSDRPSAPANIEDYAAAMGELCDGMGLKRIDLLGNHTSSSTALELARQRPRLVRRIVINSALMYTPEDRARYRAKLPGMAPATREAAAAAMPELWKSLRSFRNDLSEEDAWLLFWDMNRDPTHRAWGYAASFEYDFAKTLKQIRHPLLILNSRDELFEITSRARGVMPNAEVMDLGWGSGTFTIHAREVADIVRGFMDA